MSSNLDLYLFTATISTYMCGLQPSRRTCAYYNNLDLSLPATLVHQHPSLMHLGTILKATGSKQCRLVSPGDRVEGAQTG